MKRSKIVNGVEFEDISGYGNYPYYNPKTQSTSTKPNKYNYFVENWKRIWKWWDEIPSRRPDDYIFISSSYVGGIITIDRAIYGFKWTRQNKEIWYISSYLI